MAGIPICTLVLRILLILFMRIATQRGKRVCRFSSTVEATQIAQKKFWCDFISESAPSEFRPEDLIIVK